jgi:hypothetical protein
MTGPVKTGASEVGQKNGAPRRDQVCSRLFSSATARSIRSWLMSRTLACRASSTDPGGLFWMPHRPAATSSPSLPSRSAR